MNSLTRVACVWLVELYNGLNYMEEEMMGYKLQAMGGGYPCGLQRRSEEVICSGKSRKVQKRTARKDKKKVKGQKAKKITKAKKPKKKTSKIHKAKKKLKSKKV